MSAYTDPLPWHETGWETIVADPPWDFRAGKASRITPRYPTLSVREICELPVAAIAAPRAALFLWVTSSHLAEGLRVMSRWDFAFKATMVWVKGRIDGDRLVQHIGMGSYVRNAHELVLVGSRGGWVAPLEARNVPSVFVAPRGEHSAKPPELFDLASRLGPWPRLELFARAKRHGWTTWGNEVAVPA